MSPTQKLRDLIEDMRMGHATTTDLHNALLELEVQLGLPATLADFEVNP